MYYFESEIATVYSSGMWITRSRL